MIGAETPRHGEHTYFVRPMVALPMKGETTMDLNTMISGVVLTKTITVSPDEDAKKAGEKKIVILKVKYDGLTLNDVFLKALDKDVVSWQNGSGGRKNYDNLKNNATVNVDAKAPGKAPQIDPEEAVAANLATMTPDEQQAYFKDLLKKAEAKK